MFRIFGREGYIFTDKKNPKWGIMSTILGLIAGVSIGLAIHRTYLNQGAALMQYGAVVLLAMFYAAAGLVLGIRSLMEKDISGYGHFSECAYSDSEWNHIVFRGDLR